MRERRKFTRSRVLKGAKLALGTSSVIDCVVRNLTNVGAHIQIPNTTHLPEIMDMTFDGGRSFRSCRIVWRTLKDAGVEFL